MAKHKAYMPRVEVYFYYCPECYRHGIGAERHDSFKLTYAPRSLLCDNCHSPLLRSVVGIETLKPDVFLDFLVATHLLTSQGSGGGAA